MKKKLFSSLLLLFILTCACNRKSDAEKYDVIMNHTVDSLQNLKSIAHKKRCENIRFKMEKLNSEILYSKMADTIDTNQVSQEINEEEIDDFIEHYHTENREESNDSIFFENPSLVMKSFDKKLISLDTVFFNEIEFYADTFREEVNFTDEFKSDLTVDGSHFEGTANFKIKVLGDLYLSSNEFKSNFDLSYSHIKGIASLGGNQFRNSDFSYIEFNDNVFLNNVFFDGNINFSGTHFSTLVDFRGLTLSDSAYFSFENTILADTINFSYSGNIKNEIDLSKASFTDSLHYNKYSGEYTRPHLINLYKSDISKFILDYTHFRLIIADSVEDKNHTKQFLKVSKDEIDGMYEALLNNFKSRGQLESYKFLDIEYQKYKWKNSRFSAFVVFPEYWWNFGYDRERIFYWIVVFLTFFSLITFFSLEYLNSVYEVKGVEIIPLKKFIKRFWFSFIYTSIIFFLLTLKVDKIKFKKFWGTFFIMLMYTTGIICLAYMANYVLQK